MEFLATLIAIAIIYLLPTIIAILGKKENALAIFVLNLFLGWSMIGWIIALIWSVSKDRR